MEHLQEEPPICYEKNYPLAYIVLILHPIPLFIIMVIIIAMT